MTTDEQVCSVCGTVFDCDQHGLGVDRDGERVWLCSLDCADNIDPEIRRASTSHNMGPRAYRGGRWN